MVHNNEMQTLRSLVCIQIPNLGVSWIQEINFTF